MLKGNANVDSEVQQQVAADVNEKLEGAMESLKQKHASGNRDIDNSVNKPTGSEYQKANALRQQALKDEARMKAEQQSIFNFVDEVHQKLPTEDDKQLEEDDENGIDEDNELRILRQQRLKQIKLQHTEKIENLAKGHGQYREVVQDEFLNEVTTSVRVIAHFYHRDFPRCEIMNHHLAKLATRHIETKFIKINADKAPFFVDKLTIRTIPTLVYLIDGVAKGKLVGFEEIAAKMPEGKEDEWPTIFLARILAANNMINKEAIVDDDGVEAAMKAKMEQMRNQGLVDMMKMDLDDDDLEDLET
mmetsp:Transcript_20340/g.20460  ORF Transcript_20340/g.20460 Transcript_20340/m.20460 type:complete len:303 (-) Transcript_20340:39-947(-)|eukprot:CAMPEP_0182417190 /NCGR_PEP_ID=MMETSP1167-20130531/1606_1 /TAXON_ID=2988 /ORGANISM="Mallomonas Sp, Strain CCMP3275" /LENGTH=302 /DNA_ID=CAMNT_0024590559 /DNA_START=157 /DNA_END=1061 /DNA_ORIENTATION=-